MSCYIKQHRKICTKICSDLAVFVHTTIVTFMKTFSDTVALHSLCFGRYKKKEITCGNLLKNLKNTFKYCHNKTRQNCPLP